MPNRSKGKDDGTSASMVGRNQGGMGGHAGAAGKSDAEISTENVFNGKKQNNNEGT